MSLLPAGAVDRAISTRRPVAVPDLPEYHKEPHGGGPQTQSRSCLVVPLVVRGDAFGVLVL